ncbi:hypothetical protein [Caenispirillum salinarum]|uniref:subtilisin-like serine protease QhpE n=1 Tax=Caenispirillum salinarum TaxID=859058 RepID=UPI00384B5707
MMDMVIGIIDSGGPSLDGARRFVLTDGGVTTAAPLPDRLRHGSTVEAVMRRALPGVSVRHAQVFGDRPVTSAAQVAAAVRWLALEQDAPLLCLSLGLPTDRAVLRDACAEAIAAGAVLVAAAPAQGAACYPAAYPSVIAATGDARCRFDEISALPHALGAWCSSPEHGDGGGMGGASIGCARLAAHAARMMMEGVQDVRAALEAAAVYYGRERKGIPA